MTTFNLKANMVRIGRLIGPLSVSALASVHATNLRDEVKPEQFERPNISRTSAIEFLPSSHKEKRYNRSAQLTIHNRTPYELVFQTADIEGGQWVSPSAPTNIKPLSCGFYLCQSTNAYQALDVELQFSYRQRQDPILIHWRVPLNGNNTLVIKRPEDLHIHRAKEGQNWGGAHMVGTINFIQGARL